MYTTIEPRLIALLNNDVSSNSYSSTPSLDLPPLHDPNILKASGRPLLLEPDTTTRNGKHTPTSSLSAQHHALPIQNEEEDGNPPGGTKQKLVKSAIDRALGSSSPQSLRKILDDVNENGPAPSKKRPIPENSKDDFVQLPQPPKKHKAAKQAVPPIIIGLFEPPPQAALFPPIASSSFHDSHGRNSLNTVPMKQREMNGPPSNVWFEDAEKEVAQVMKPKKKKDARPRRKWTEEETNNLLLGVHKHGVGNWTDILADQAFPFSGRSGADLKDRFRTCCPAELRGNNSPADPRLGKRVKSTSSLMSENILIDDNEGSGGEDGKPRKSRAHRKKLEDLAELGIEGPFRKSLRRERRPFSDEEDREILQGYSSHGPAWTRIQRDPRFHLQSRQPTDLRDRFRNKYPEKFRADDKSKEKEKEVHTMVKSSQSSTESLPQLSASKREGRVAEPKQASVSLQLQDVDDRAKENTVFYPNSSIHPSSSREGLRIQEMITTSSSPPKNANLPTQANLYNNFTFPEQPNMESDTMPFSQSFDWANTIAAPFTGTMGEMDISRLLLDESWPDLPTSTTKEKQQSFTNINSIISSSAETGGNDNPFYTMLEDPEIINASFG